MSKNPPRGPSLAGQLPNIPPRVARQAVQWLVELQSGHADEATRAGLQRWLGQHPDHATAWQHIDNVNRRLAGLGAAGGHAPVHAALAPAARRRAIKTLLLLLGAGSAAWLAHERPWDDQGEALASAVGQHRTLTLDDGTRVVMDTDTRLRVQYDQNQRRIALLQGAIMVSTAPDHAIPSRSLLVSTAHGLVQPLGTVFVVRQQAELTLVQVLRDRVRLHPRDAHPHATDPGGDGDLLLQAGQQAELTSTQARAVQALDEGAGAWAEGVLVASDMRLDQFVDEVRRYRRGHLGYDPSLAALRISGSYRLDDTDGILQALAASQPLEVRHFTRYWTTLLPRQK